MAATPERVWPFITEPAQMNRWSLARIRLVAPGDGGRAVAVGAVREVSVSGPGPTVRFKEIIERVEPPSRFVYRVISGLPVRHHRGEITLRPEGDGTILRWDVEFRFRLKVTELLVRAILKPQLRSSLAALAEVVRDAPAASVPDATTLDDPAELPALYAAAEAVLAEQHELAARLTAAEDAKRWFAQVYAYVTESQIAACRAGRLPHPGWVLRVLPRFHYYYLENLRRWTGEADGPVERHWRLAFEALEGRPDRLARVSGGSTRGLAEAVRAHVDGDLPRALADVYVTHYAGRCTYARFRADYTLMTEIFPGARSRLIRTMPLPLQVVCLGVPVELRERLAAWLHYDLPRHRRRAFERGEQLAALMLLLGPYRAQRHIATVLPALAPAGEPDQPAGEVDGDAAGGAQVLTLDSPAERAAARAHLLGLLELAELEEDPEERRSLLTVVIIGGNLAGVQVALELIDYFLRVNRREYPRIHPEEARLVIVHRGDGILPELRRSHPRLVNAVERHLEKLGLRVRLGTDLATATPDEAILSSGEHIPTRTIIAAGDRPPGAASPDLFAACGLGQRTAVAQLGRVAFGGLPAWLTWRAALLVDGRSTGRQPGSSVDWLLNLRAEESESTDQHGVSELLIEPGQVIVEQGDVGRALYVIVSGEVEVLHREDGHDRRLAVLGPGDHFGEIAVFQNVRRTATVRALTRGHVLALGRTAALSLSQTNPTFGEAIRRLPRPAPLAD